MDLKDAPEVVEGLQAPATAWRSKQRAQLRAAVAEVEASRDVGDVSELEHPMSQLALGTELVSRLSVEAVQDPSTSTNANAPPDAPDGVGLSPDPVRADETDSTDSRADSSPSRSTHPIDAPTPDRIATISSELDDISYLQLAFIQAMIAFTSSGNTLRFVLNPIPDTPYERWTPESTNLVNGGDAALDGKQQQNLVFLEYQSWLAEAYYALKAMGVALNADADERRDQLLARIGEELAALEDVKEMEWERQQLALAEATQHGSLLTVDTSRHFSSQWASWSAKAAPIYAFSIVSATSSLLLGLSRKATAALMGGMHSTIKLTLEYARAPEPLTAHDHHLLRQLARDPRTILSAFDLDPCVTVYNCCSECFALYNTTGAVPTTCTYRSTPQSHPCDAPLSRTRTIRGKQISFPIRKYLHQSMKHWLGRMLSCEEIERWLETRRQPADPSAPMTDIFDGLALRYFTGPDGALFLNHVGDELRLVFSLSADGFNPYQMKEAKHSVSSTAIYMVCLNLPPHLRYLPENMYLVGVIPGPTKPSLEQMNHLLAPLVDELLDFWDPGVWYTRTSLRSYGRRARAAMVPLVADLLAARQLSGHGPHNHKYSLCTLCKASQDDIESTALNRFLPRDPEDHRRAAKQWLEAESTLAREHLFSQTGVRYSELLRLKYWDPCMFVVIDTMHNLYLGLLQRHVRTFWGISVDSEDGDASGLDSTAPPPRPSGKKMTDGEEILLHGTMANLRKLSKAVLYHLCHDRGLRRAGFKAQLLKNLDAWRRREGISDRSEDAKDGSRADDFEAELVSMYGDHLTKDIRLAEASLRKGNKASTLQRAAKDVLVAMCQARQLGPEGPKPELAARLVEYRDSHVSQLTPEDASVHESVDRIDIEYQASEEELGDDDTEASTDAEVEDEEEIRHAYDAIGKETLAAYREDRARTELPSWVNAPPASFGTSQHGKLGADHWRTLCVVHLPITLIRTWGFQEPRRVQMLQNFLDLVEAVEICGLMEIDEERIKCAEDLMHRYLVVAKELYKGAKIQPNHHLALHLGVFLRLFGPVHSWRSFVFERFNFFLQSLNTNMKFGDLEITFMMQSCRMANFRPLLRSPVVRSQMTAFSESLRALNKDDQRGMRFDAILRSTDAPALSSLPWPEEHRKGSRRAALDSGVFDALLTRLNSNNSEVYVRDDHRNVPSDVLPLSEIVALIPVVSISGVLYKSRTRAQGDSNIIFQHPSLTGKHAGRIEQIFLHKRDTTTHRGMVEAFLVVKRLEELDEDDSKQDPYRRFAPIGGMLYYHTYSPDLLVLRTTDVICHFAKTMMDHLAIPRDDEMEDGGDKMLVSFKRPCVHVRPLDRLLRDADLSVAGKTTIPSEDVLDEQQYDVMD